MQLRVKESTPAAVTIFIYLWLVIHSLQNPSVHSVIPYLQKPRRFIILYQAVVLVPHDTLGKAQRDLYGSRRQKKKLETINLSELQPND
jgi:hypothetical protein